MSTELRARLLAEAEKAIDTLLAEKPGATDITLSEIEGLVLKSRQEFAVGVLSALTQEGSQAQQDADGECPWCGSRMQRRGQRERQVKTEVGDMTLERAYYVCSGCKRGLFPPG